MLPSKLQPGHRVHLASPASPAGHEWADGGRKVLESMGLKVEKGAHVYDVDKAIDYLAGSDADRLADVNDALRDPGIKAIVATCGGLPIGRGKSPIAVPIGTRAVMDADRGTLTV